MAAASPQQSAAGLSGTLQPILQANQSIRITDISSPKPPTKCEEDDVSRLGREVHAKRKYHSDEEPDENDSYNTVTNKKDKKLRAENQNQNTPNEGKSKDHLKFAAYMSGVECNISKEAVRYHQKFRTEITSFCGPVDIIEARKGCIRFVCNTEEQRQKLLNIQTVLDN